jgi:hypothetical protein
MGEAMKKYLAALGIFAILAVSTTFNPALAATADVYQQVKGDAADTTFFHFDGCISSYVQVTANTNTTKGGTSSSSTYAYVYVNWQNYCTNEYLYASGYGDPATYQFSVSGSTAVLKGSFAVYKYWTGLQYGPGTAVIDLQWKGNNDATRTRNVSRSQSPSGMMIYSTTGVTATATATGSIVIDGAPIISASDTSTNASIATNSTGQITVVRPGPKTITGTP